MVETRKLEEDHCMCLTNDGGMCIYCKEQRISHLEKELANKDGIRTIVEVAEDFLKRIIPMRESKNEFFILTAYLSTAVNMRMNEAEAKKLADNISGWEMFSRIGGDRLYEEYEGRKAQMEMDDEEYKRKIQDICG